MWIGIAVAGYVIGVALLVRFFQTVHRWDDEIEAMGHHSKHAEKKQEIHCNPAA
jgi:hypothetical protein